MALSDILSTIEQQTSAAVEQIRLDGEKEKKQLAKELAQELESRKQELLDQFQRRAEKKVSQAAWEFSSRANTSVLQKKQELLDEVFGTAIAQLAELPKKEYTTLITRLLKSLPQLPTDATIRPAKGKEKETAEAVQESSLQIAVAKETVDSAGGFIIEGELMNINMTVEALVNSYRTVHEPTIAAKLFS